MGLFRKKSSGEENIKVSKQEKAFKYRSDNVHDPVLLAVNEAQPFEQQANSHQRNISLTASTDSGAPLKDIFGSTINDPDMSNPTRARDERPLDTIRAFEYAISGDASYKGQLETPSLGFAVRPNFPGYQTNPYGGSYDEQSAGLGYASGRPTMALGGNQEAFESSVPQEGAPKEKKKKRGLFGRKK